MPIAQLALEEKIEYFKRKGIFEQRKTSPHSEFESKFLNVDPENVRRTLERIGCMQVFGGIVESLYFSVGRNFLTKFFHLGETTASGIFNDSSGERDNSGFLRLRKMTDDSDSSIFYFVETKFKGLRGRLSSEPVSPSVVFDPESSLEYGGFVDDLTYGLYLITCRSECGDPREVEIKKRESYIIRDFAGLEYSLDSITKPVTVAPYLEVEGSSETQFVNGVRMIDKDPSDFTRISARRLIIEARRTQVSEPDLLVVPIPDGEID